MLVRGTFFSSLLEPADIHTDDEGSRLVVSHSDSRTRKDARSIVFFARQVQFPPNHLRA